ncbi:hypothetical protein BDA99DRAFT_500589 [Phascolomyces articulosus]|uniref:Secreted protein n=1 Tax=Phascolomyces articulosus TaxID=60185 RepID=A0AAD5PHC3_9FUNG|nr:hypothetical protein BDA99DRAFT_500589 [Phascolomyces articulosus]
MQKHIFALLASYYLFTTTQVNAAPVEVLDPSQLVLEGKPGVYDGIIAKLDEALPVVSVGTVLDNTNHPNLNFDGPDHFIEEYTWDMKDGYNDVNTLLWYPQGITTSSDAYDDGLYEGDNVVLVSWYDKRVAETDPTNKGVRISFIDQSTKEYRNCLLVVPDDGDTPSFHTVKIHAGGIMWYGHHLFVVDTWKGVRIFDLRHIYEVSIGGGIGHVGSGRFEAYNYRYVIPQSGHYLAEGFRFSFISLDRTTTPDSFLVGEYDATGASSRVARFEIDAETRLPTHSSGTTAPATEMFNSFLTSTQGVTSVTTTNGTSKYYFSCSRGVTGLGDLFTWVSGEQQEPTEHADVLHNGPEDLSYRKQGDQLWTLGEHPGERPVYALKAGDY